MAFERPPMLTGDSKRDLTNLRDYLFRMANSLNGIAGADNKDLAVSYTRDGRQVLAPAGGGSVPEIQQIRNQANELRDLIIKTANGVNIEITNRVNGDAALDAALKAEGRTRAGADADFLDSLAAEVAARVQSEGALQADILAESQSRADAYAALQGDLLTESRLREDGEKALSESLQEEVTGALSAARDYADQIGEGVIQYADQKVEEYNGLYVAKSEYGTFLEGITGRIETTARGVVESYDYASAIEGVQNNVNELQKYYTAMTGVIQRGIVQDPSTGNYVMGIAIAQDMEFTGQTYKAEDDNIYYYLADRQTFGLYTSTGWQFWIKGVKVGWFDSQDGMLHVGTVHVEDRIVNGGYWEEKTESINGMYMFAINYIGS